MTTGIDHLKRITSVSAQTPSPGYSSALTLGYDKNNRITKVGSGAASASFFTNYTFDKLRLDKVQTNGLSTVNSTDAANVKYEYYPNGALNSITYPPLVDGSILKTEYQYNALNQMMSITNWKGSSVLSSTSQTYDNNGNIETVTQVRLGEATTSNTYTYDKLNRLETITRHDGKTIIYTYDTKGNRQTAKEAFNLDSIAYEYDLYNTLTSVTKGGQTTAFEYSPDGLRYKKTAGAAVTQYRYNQNREVVAEVNANNQTTAHYVRGDRLLVKKDVATAKDYYYLYNAHGDVIQIVDTNGVVQNSYKYDEWGNIVGETETIDNAFKYAGEIHDEETGLYYLRARYYDPGIGRFINEDTYEGELNNPLSLNLYTYVVNNPLNYIDPSGHMAVAFLNSYLRVYIRNSYQINEYTLAEGVLKQNGEGSIYTGFHEIAQIHAGRQIYSDIQNNAQIPDQAKPYLIPTLEYKIQSTQQKWNGKCCKSYEADIVSLGQVWEVKPLAGKDPKPQLERYKKEGQLELGYQLQTMDVGIIDFGKVLGSQVDLRMIIESPKEGEIRYSFYLLSDGDRVDISNAEARIIVDDYYFDSGNFKFKIKK